jgi:hypothetical protein
MRRRRSRVKQKKLLAEKKLGIPKKEEVPQEETQSLCLFPFQIYR